MTNHLFVYGLLKSSFHTHIPELRVSAMHFTGKGAAAGLLYDVGRYPGACFDPESNKKVYGEVYELNDQIDVLDLLDDFEGVHDEDPEYQRVPVEVTLPKTGQRLSCWAYEYRRSTNDLRPIENGKYEGGDSFDITKI